jgi:hypothetical protein
MSFDKNQGLQYKITAPEMYFALDKTLGRKILRQVGQEIAAAARAMLGRASHKKGTHTPSQPGSPPASLTGLLRRSIKVSQRGDRVKIKATATNPKGAPYGVFMEAGSVGGGGKGNANLGRSHKRGGSKGTIQTSRVQAARPFLSVAVAAGIKDLGPRLAEAMRQGIDLKTLRKTA